MKINDHKVKRSHVHDDIIKYIDSVFNQYGLEINTIHCEQILHLTEYTITCSDIAPMQFLVRYNTEDQSYLVIISDNTYEICQQSPTFRSSLQCAFEDAVFAYKEYMGCYAKLYNILSKTI